MSLFSSLSRFVYLFFFSKFFELKFFVGFVQVYATLAIARTTEERE